MTHGLRWLLRRIHTTTESHLRICDLRLQHLFGLLMARGTISPYCPLHCMRISTQSHPVSHHVTTRRHSAVTYTSTVALCNPSSQYYTHVIASCHTPPRTPSHLIPLVCLGYQAFPWPDKPGQAQLLFLRHTLVNAQAFGNQMCRTSADGPGVCLPAHST